jgi:hypothetical protein
MVRRNSNRSQKKTDRENNPVDTPSSIKVKDEKELERQDGRRRGVPIPAPVQDSRRPTADEEDQDTENGDNKATKEVADKSMKVGNDDSASSSSSSSSSGGGRRNRVIFDEEENADESHPVVVKSEFNEGIGEEKVEDIFNTRTGVALGMSSDNAMELDRDINTNYFNNLGGDIGYDDDDEDVDGVVNELNPLKLPYRIPKDKPLDRNIIIHDKDGREGQGQGEIEKIQNNRMNFMNIQFPSDFMMRPCVDENDAKKVDLINENDTGTGSIATLTPGKIGKLQLLKSGKMRIVLEDGRLYDLKRGLRTSFQQYMCGLDLSPGRTLAGSRLIKVKNEDGTATMVPEKNVDGNLFFLKAIDGGDRYVAVQNEN